MTETKKLWTEEDELAYLAGDMNGILYQDENREEGPKEVKIDSNDKPDIKITDTPFWMNIKR